MSANTTKIETGGLHDGIYHCVSGCANIYDALMRAIKIKLVLIAS